MKLVLFGQPNSGKSTIFNAVAGYRSATANFPGSSVSSTTSRVLISSREIDIVDLPGVYSVSSPNREQSEAYDVVLDGDYDVIINVVDASRLGRSLELTLQLLELGKPIVLALNMIDEATYHGIEIDHDALAKHLGIPVVPTVGRYGHGLHELFQSTIAAASAGGMSAFPRYDREVEAAIERIATLVAATNHTGLPTRMVAIKCLDRDPNFVTKVIEEWDESLRHEIDVVITELSTLHGWSADQVVAGNRHTVAHRIEDTVTTMHQPRLGAREYLNRLLVHPVSGGPLMLLILGAFFYLVYGVGRYLETPLISIFEWLHTEVLTWFPHDSLLGALSGSVLMGISGGVAIVLPYLVPFLIGLAIIEDTGYLPRVAYILDSFMHRIGLHGKSVLPIILGYGCSVPAIMAARILESPRDRRITAALAAFVPCSARTVVIYGLVAAYMGPFWALAVYLLNIILVVAMGSILTRRIKGSSPGLIIEMPDLRLPVIRTLLAKTWLSLKEFITIAWPLLIGSSIILGLLEWLHADAIVNRLLAPLTVTALGLPVAVGVSLIFGVLRKELTLVMLVQALGTAQLASVMTTGQLMTYTLFVVFYVPCVATVAVLAREVGWKDAALISALAVALATAIGVLSRLGFALASMSSL